MTRDEMLDVVVRWQEALARHDLEAFTRLYAETAVLESPVAGSVTGRIAIMNVTMTLLSAFPDRIMSFEPPVIDGDRAAIGATVTGTHMGAFMGLPPTGKKFRFSLVYLLVVRNGQIVHDRRVYDFKGFLVQLGLLKAKPV